MRMMPGPKERPAPDEGMNGDHSATGSPNEAGLAVVHCSFTWFVGMCGRERAGLARLNGSGRDRGAILSQGASLYSQRMTDGRYVSMKKMLALSLALAAGVSVSACQTPQQQNALAGGVLGGGTGALIGSAVSHGSAGGTLAGAAIGAASGAMIGSAATPQYQGQCARWGYDYNGNRICVAYY
jgi:hypothetical protein